MNKNLKKFLTGTAVLSALVISSSLYSCASKEFKEFTELLKNENYTEAADYFLKNKDEIEDENLIDIVKESVDKIFDSYLNDKMNSENALINLSALLSINAEEVSEYIDEKITFVSELENSKLNYKTAESYYEEKRYDLAIEYYRNVIEKDPNYQIVQKKIEQALKEYKTSILNEAESYMENENFNNAINSLNSAMDKFDDTTELKNKLDECEKKYKEKLFSDAEAYASNGDYKNAVNYLDSHVKEFSDSEDIKNKIQEYNEQYENAMLDESLTDTNEFIKNGDYYNALEAIHEIENEYPDNKKLQELKESTENTYLDNLIPLIDEYIENQKYSDAYSVCNNALNLIPDSDELKKRMEIIEPLKPVLLSEIKISESEFFEQLTDHASSFEDVVGNRYNPGNLFRLHLYHDGWGGNEDGYAKIYLNAQYTKLKGTIAVDDESETGNCIVSVYGDDQILFSGTFDRTSPPQDIEIDVTGKQWLEFTVAYPAEDTYGYKSEILFANIGLEK